MLIHIVSPVLRSKRDDLLLYLVDEFGILSITDAIVVPMKLFVRSLAVFFFFYTLISSGQVAMDPGRSILENTAGSENYKVLSAVMKASNLDEILGQNGPFTVFAPSDTAFKKKLPAAKMSELLTAENNRNVRDLMAYHMVAGNLTAAKIIRALCSGKGRASFTTVQGDEIIATMSGLDIILTDSGGNTAKIVMADANQSNGVIHEIDSVILPGKI